ncbi:MULTISPECIES: hypothetical protein [unclassified Streptomyces]|uniref:hypothetical protein n=1 Tax=unclassified Streptomyces TaxID=2593676 RepID=UPI00331B3B3B
MPWIFTVTSRKGEPVNPITGAPTDSINVWTEANLHRRLAIAKNDPRDLVIEVQPFTPKGA